MADESLVWISTRNEVGDKYAPILQRLGLSVTPVSPTLQGGRTVPRDEIKRLCPALVVVEVEKFHDDPPGHCRKLIEWIHAWDSMTAIIALPLGDDPDLEHEIDSLLSDLPPGALYRVREARGEDALQQALETATKRARATAIHQITIDEFSPGETRVIQGLFRYHRGKTASVRRMRPGYSQSRVYEMRFRYGRKEALSYPFVLKIGPRKLKEEFAKYRNHVHDRIPHVEADLVLGGNHCAILYGRAGGPSARELTDLKRVIQDVDNWSTKAIQQVLSRLFTEQMKQWLPTTTRQRTIGEEYEGFVSWRRLDQQTARMFGHRLIEDYITVPWSTKPVRNPIFLGRALLRWDQRLPFPTRIVHGDLHCENLVIDDQGQEWLIDFGRTTKGHAIRDFAALETSIKFDTLYRSLFLEDLIDFDRKLLAIAPSPEIPDSVKHPFLRRCAEVISHVRALALDTGALSTQAGRLEYLLCLFYWALRQTMYVDLNQKFAFASAVTIGEILSGELCKVGWVAERNG